jgi:2-phosphosulfolactate phosphatase
VTDTIDIAVTPGEALLMPADCFVVVDVLRATTTIATLFGRGILDLVVVDDIELARRRAHDEARLLFGEVGGLTPRGFDHGNSPLEASGLDVAGRRALLFTTNGTTALCALAGRGAVVAGAPANVAAMARLAATCSRVVVVCAGSDRGARFALDDFVAAGVIAAAVSKRSPAARVGDAARVATELIEGAAGRLSVLLRESHHGRLLAHLGLAADIEFCARIDSSAAVPVVVDSGPGWATIEDRPGRNG